MASAGSEWPYRGRHSSRDIHIRKTIVICHSEQGTASDKTSSLGPDKRIARDHDGIRKDACAFPRTASPRPARNLKLARLDRRMPIPPRHTTLLVRAKIVQAESALHSHVRKRKHCQEADSRSSKHTPPICQGHAQLRSTMLVSW